ncbi:MAG: exopolysaccharide Pel transporter PelG [Proteobacteria bacterium]|nr:exopolysaccharide Pel transporter PelG [Pseudomonadota bacterium]MBU1595733.1 exopolysaccharide Pel transporter PelG [Pseudomonadota bacterium]
MAGIGFELRKLLDKDNFIGDLRAFLYAALLSSGPWLLSITCLGVLTALASKGGTDQDGEIFRTTVVYVFAFSLIFVGIFQLVLTRFLADRLYLKDDQAMLPAFVACVIMVMLGGLVVGLAVFHSGPLPWTYKALAIALFDVVSLLWLTMIMLSAVKDYNNIVIGFAVGAILSVAGVWALEPVLGLHGRLLGYLLGMAVSVFWFLAIILSEFDQRTRLAFDVVPYFKKYWDLAMVGFVYNLAIWVDKFVFWMAPDARTIVVPLTVHDFYEGPVFLSYLSIVPALSVFMVKVETGFYEHYRRYYQCIAEKRPLSALLEEKAGMAEMLKASIREMFIIQGGVTVLCVVFAPEILAFGKLSPIQVPLFRISLIGSFLQALMSLTVIILFYFDLRLRVMAITFCYLVLNAGLSQLSLWLGFPFYGFGYAYACFFSLMLGFFLLVRTVQDLEFITFTRQPI